MKIQVQDAELGYSISLKAPDHFDAEAWMQKMLGLLKTCGVEAADRRLQRVFDAIDPEGECADLDVDLSAEELHEAVLTFISKRQRGQHQERMKVICETYGLDQELVEDKTLPELADYLEWEKKRACMEPAAEHELTPTPLPPTPFADDDNPF